MGITRKIAAAVTMLATAAAILVVTGCGSSQPVTYAPTAYGVPGHCYYVDDPAEAYALRNAGRCPRSWAPALMPLLWHQRYYAYYDSPAYYGTYVPSRIRTVYVQQQSSFGRIYGPAIRTQAKAATYRSSDGGTVSGSKISTSKTRFGSGTSFGQSGSKYGGGSGRSGGSGGSGRSGGFGGGGGRSGGGSSGGHGGR